MKFGGRVHSQEELKIRLGKEKADRVWRGGFTHRTCWNGLHKMSEDNIFLKLHHGIVVRLCLACKKAANKRAMQVYRSTNMRRRREAMRPYPGQGFFRRLNPRICRAEENWEIVHGLRKAR